MKLKNYSLLLAFFAVTFTANAQNITGTYNGTMTVEVVVPFPDEVEFPNQDIIISEDGNHLFKLSILDFSFFGLEFGNLEVTGISSSTNDIGTIILSKEGFSEGPTVDLGEGNELPTVITLNFGEVTVGGGLRLDLSVDIYLHISDDLIIQENVANVTFTGNVYSGIFSPKADRIAVYPTVATDVITIEGFENAEFSIFNQSGQLVKQGRLTSETINVSALNTDIYFLNINGFSGMFIKR